MATKEVITLQLGHYANFIGTHWWNIQESSFQYSETPNASEKEDVDHDVLFREGRTRRGEVTFTPRLVLAELKGGLGCLKASGTLYDGDTQTRDPLDEICWSGKTEVHKHPPNRRSQFLLDLENGTSDEISDILDEKVSNGLHGKPTKNEKKYDLETGVRVWSDFLRPHLHPKSTVIVNEYNHDSENDPFDLWAKGIHLKRVCDELEERIRFYAEECDFMQGFHILSDMHTGFSGLSSSMLHYLHDEFGSKQLAVFPVYPAAFPGESIIMKQKRLLTSSLALSCLMEHSSLLCPLSLSAGEHSRQFPHLIYDASSSFHTSAILASGLDTITLKHRMKKTAVNLQQFCTDVTSSCKNLVSLSMSLPIPLLETERRKHEEHSSNLPEFLLQNFDSDPCTLLSTDMSCSMQRQSTIDDYYSQSVTLRGVPNEKIHMEKTRKRDNPLYHCESGEEMLKLYLNEKYYGCRNNAYVINDPLRTSLPYPQIFDEGVGRNGYLHTNTPWGAGMCFEVPDPEPHQNGHIGRNGHSITGLPDVNLNGADCSSGLQYGGYNSVSSHGATNGNMSNRITASKSKSFVESVPVMTNVQCSSKSTNLLKFASTCLREGRKRHFSFHGMENENMEVEIERLCSFEDEYKGSHTIVSSDSDDDF